MFIEFSVANFRSIGERQTLSLLPALNQKDFLQNIISDGKNYSLNTAAIYGANGSGKSNLLKAFSTFHLLIKASARFSSTDKLVYDPFLLREGWDEKPTYFELVFGLDESRYRYGYEYNEQRVLREWLFRKNVGREVMVYQRKNDVIETSSSLKGNSKIIDAAIEATRENSLFLSMLDTFNVEEANKIIKLFTNCIHVDGMRTNRFRNLEATWKGESIKKDIVNYLKRLKLGINDIEVLLEEGKKESSNKKEIKILSKHTLYDKAGKPTDQSVSWEYLQRESRGSIKALEISAPLVVVLALGGLLVVDELEAQMHPLLTIDTINLFLNKATNPKEAQLIFATHDTNLLSYTDLRRDQIYFAEKNSWESTEIYSLSDFVYINDKNGGEIKERPDTDKEKRYIEGRYGAVPVLGPLANLMPIHNGKKR